jgi:hypothetical protein
MECIRKHGHGEEEEEVEPARRELDARAETGARVNLTRDASRSNSG